MLTLRPMTVDDLPIVGAWLAEPHVARWYLAGSSVAQELDDLEASVLGAQAVNPLVVAWDGSPAGWCQWYLCRDDPEWAADIGAEPDAVGIDYAIGEASLTGRGIGTSLVAALVERVRSRRPGCPVMADPDSRNKASCRVLEKNGFELLAVRSLPSERTDDPMAIYRLPGGAAPGLR